MAGVSSDCCVSDINAHKPGCQGAGLRGEQRGSAGVEVNLGARCRAFRWEEGALGNKQVLFSQAKARYFTKLKWSIADGLGLK